MKAAFKNKPTKEFYDLFDFMHGFFNRILFDKKLKPVMIVITRKKSFGHYSPERWINEKKIRSDEIAINPAYFNQFPLIEILQTMVHEMCHQWQQHYGSPSINYHNKEFANKMISIGLMPSKTGMVGGAITGPTMADYPIKGGYFVKAANEFVKSAKFNKLWFDRLNTAAGSVVGELYNDLNLAAELLHVFNSEAIAAVPSTARPTKSKEKYTCNTCNLNVWGKLGMNIICGDCGNNFEKPSITDL